jgi:hypothetical protein
VKDEGLMELVNEVHRLRNENEALKITMHEQAVQLDEFLSKTGTLPEDKGFIQVTVRLTHLEVMRATMAGLKPQAVRRLFGERIAEAIPENAMVRARPADGEIAYSMLVWVR